MRYSRRQYLEDKARRADVTNAHVMQRDAAKLVSPAVVKGPLAKQFTWAWQAVQGPALEAEHKFHPERRFRFDFAHLPSRVAIEIEGGTWVGGRHTTGAGFLRDCEKYNEAALLGWRVVRLTTDQVANTLLLARVRDMMLAAAAVPAPQSAPSWVDVRETMPDDEMTVLIALSDGEVWTGFHAENAWRHVSADLVDQGSGTTVTHWMHLAAGPGNNPA